MYIHKCRIIFERKQKPFHIGFGRLHILGYKVVLKFVSNEDINKKSLSSFSALLRYTHLTSTIGIAHAQEDICGHGLYWRVLPQKNHITFERDVNVFEGRFHRSWVTRQHVFVRPPSADS